MDWILTCSKDSETISPGLHAINRHFSVLDICPVLICVRLFCAILVVHSIRAKDCNGFRGTKGQKHLCFECPAFRRRHITGHLVEIVWVSTELETH